MQRTHDRDAGLSFTQVTNWFFNKRKRSKVWHTATEHAAAAAAVRLASLHRDGANDDGSLEHDLGQGENWHVPESAQVFAASDGASDAALSHEDEDWMTLWLPTAMQDLDSVPEYCDYSHKYALSACLFI